MTLALLCPGQGTQTPGFLHRLPDHPVVAATLAEAVQVLGRHPLALDSAEALASTVAVQLSIVIAGVAAGRALAAEGVAAEAFAGLSVGSFTAAVLAGAIGFADALRLVDLRARLMAEACPTGYGLAAIIGLAEARVRALVASSHRDDAPVYLANLNGPTQFVIAGSDAGLAHCLAAASAIGARVERLDVAVPSHCPLMDGVAAALASAIEAVPLRPPSALYLANDGGRVTRDAAAVRADLARNVARPVQWHRGVSVLGELGIGHFLELPPGHALADLARAAVPPARAAALDDLADFDRACAWARHGAMAAPINPCRSGG